MPAPGPYNDHVPTVQIVSARSGRLCGLHDEEQRVYSANGQARATTYCSCVAPHAVLYASQPLSGRGLAATASSS
eukprot:334356-Pleurochrysis_carterae.AAC.4